MLPPKGRKDAGQQRSIPLDQNKAADAAHARAVAPSVVVHLFVVPLNQIIIPYLDLPLGFFMAAQGALITFVIMLFVFARQQDRIDRDHFIDRG
jgi:putative solute:sodium symporter small subunit